MASSHWRRGGVIPGEDRSRRRILTPVSTGGGGVAYVCDEKRDNVRQQVSNFLKHTDAFPHNHIH